MPGVNIQSSFPSGPFTETTEPDTFTSTPVGTVIGFFPMRDIASLSFLRIVRAYHTEQSTSPPRPAFRDAWSVMTPFEVERMAIPMPFRTRGISLVPTYKIGRAHV